MYVYPLDGLPIFLFMIRKRKKVHEEHCQREGLPFVGKIPFDSDAVKAINRGQSIVDSDCVSGSAVKEIHGKVINLLFEEIPI